MPNAKIVPEFVRKGQRSVLPDPSFALGTFAAHISQTSKAAACNRQWQEIRAVAVVIRFNAQLVSDSLVSLEANLPKLADACGGVTTVLNVDRHDFAKLLRERNLVVADFRKQAVDGLVRVRPHVSMDALVVAVDGTDAVVRDPYDEDISVGRQNGSRMIRVRGCCTRAGAEARRIASLGWQPTYRGPCGTTSLRLRAGGGDSVLTTS